MPTRKTTEPFEGARHLDLTINDAPNTFTGIFQPVDEIVPGHDYEFSMWAKRDGLVSGIFEYRIEWFNAQDQLIGSRFSDNLRIGNLLSDEYQRFQNRATAPAGAVEARAVMAAVTTSRLSNLRVFVDSTSFIAIPEPSGLVLSFLALATLLTRHRGRSTAS